MTTLPPDSLVPYVYPSLYSLHNMPHECGTVGEQGVVLPPPLPLCSDRMERHGLHIMEDGQVIFLWVGRDAVPQLIQDVFGFNSVAEVPVGKGSLPQLDNDFSQRVNAIIGKIRESRKGPFCKLHRDVARYTSQIAQRFLPLHQIHNCTLSEKTASQACVCGLSALSSRIKTTVGGVTSASLTKSKVSPQLGLERCLLATDNYDRQGQRRIG